MAVIKLKFRKATTFNDDEIIKKDGKFCQYNFEFTL